ncbi:MAG: CRTAC1 family protein [Phycisphaerae bacterium]
MNDPNAGTSPDGKPSHDEEFVATDDAIIGKAFNWSMLVVAGIGLLVLAAFVWTRPSERGKAPAAVPVEPPRTVEPAVRPPEVHFVDVTRLAGISFVHCNGAVGDKLLPETMGGGVAFVDYDSDGDQDLLLINSMPWPGNAQPDRPPPTMALYQNDGAGAFSDVTKAAQLDVPMYGMGVAVGDFNGDGWIDLFVTAVGRNHLFANRGGRFEDVTATAGVAGADDAWSTCATFFDCDNDGDLDLYVGNYVRWSRAIDFEVDYKLLGVGRAYGPPMNFEGTFSQLYRNNGNGTFEDVSRAAGLHLTNPATGRPMGKALGAVPVDVDRDGWTDLFVANDTVQNVLLHNNRDGTFAERAIEFGLAFDRNGSATGAMGVDAGYYRNDDALGFFIGNFANEMTSLYVAQGDATLFADEAIGEGIGAPTRLMLSFGVMLFDYDLDGRLDLLQANGHLEEAINLVQPSQHYEQPAQLFWNCGPGTRGCFVPVAWDTAGDLGTPIVGRGSAVADIDGDGDLDAIVTQVGRRPLLLRNDQAMGHHWARFRLMANPPNTSAIGAVVQVSAGDLSMRRRVMPTRSYLSQSELPVTVGLGTHAPIEQLTITWPDGTQRTLRNLTVDRTFTIRQGEDVIR